MIKMIKKGIKTCIGIFTVGITIVIMETNKTILNYLQKIANWSFEVTIQCIGCGEEIQINDGIPFCQECKKNMNITVSEEQCNNNECNHPQQEGFISKPINKNPETGYR